MNLNELYTQIITENSRSKENRHPVEGATHSLEGVNPSCGDDITLQLRVKDGKIEDAGFIGSGCAISQASASLMIDLVKGRTVEDAHRPHQPVLPDDQGARSRPRSWTTWRT